jgi:hypothetical protein
VVARISADILKIILADLADILIATTTEGVHKAAGEVAMRCYMKAELRVVPGKMTKLLECLKGTVFPIVEANGWKLIGSFLHHTGPINILTDLWELEDFDHLARGRQALVAHPDSASFKAILAECVAEESLVLMEKLI